MNDVRTVNKMKIESLLGSSGDPFGYWIKGWVDKGDFFNKVIYDYVQDYTDDNEEISFSDVIHTYAIISESPEHNPHDWEYSFNLSTEDNKEAIKVTFMAEIT